IEAMPDRNRRARVRLLLPQRSAIIELSPEVLERAAELTKLGIKPADAGHVAAAEAQQADICLSCDDRLCRIARRLKSKLNVRVVNPLEWLNGVIHGPNT